MSRGCDKNVQNHMPRYCVCDNKKWNIFSNVCKKCHGCRFRDDLTHQYLSYTHDSKFNQNSPTRMNNGINIGNDANIGNTVNVIERMIARPQHCSRGTLIDNMREDEFPPSEQRLLVKYGIKNARDAKKLIDRANDFNNDGASNIFEVTPNFLSAGDLADQ